MTKIPTKPEDVMYTDEQWEAIHKSGHNLLVAASAGSGKTMVLVNRIIEKINHPEKNISVDDLLVVTFTNAAAKEMKQKIEDKLRSELRNNPENYKKLVNELPKLGHANISTLHSFCSKVIERYYYLIDFDPVFRMLTDETEIALIKEDVWEELLEEFYEESDPAFIELMEAYAGKGNDDQITEMVFSLHNFSQANLRPGKWLENLTSLYRVSTDQLSKSEIYQKYFSKDWLEEIDYCRTSIRTILDEIGNEQELTPQIEILEAEYNQYQKLYHLLEKDDLEAVYDLVHGDFEFKTLRAPRKKSIPDELKEYHSQITKPHRDEAKEIYLEFTQHFILSPKEQLAMLKEMEGYINTLSKITQKFSKRYQKYKMENKLIDFNDLEHLTLDILEKQEDGVISEAARYYQKKFKEVLVDEYQDINAVQEKILSLVSKVDENEGNYFMVGDVKQSIYGFRLADPELFLSKYENYQDSENGERIILAKNFRSRNEILTFTNFIFKQLMDKKLGNLSYDKNAELVSGNVEFDKYSSSSNYQTELLIYEKEKDENASSKFEELNDPLEIHTKTTGEILTVASRIIELMDEGFEIYDKKEKKMRPLEYRDIVLLTPTKKNNLEIQEIFQELDLPIAMNETQNFFQTTEVTIMVSLLKIIDNPRQDIPFVAVLRSPIVGLNEVELTYVRLEDQQADFYEATKQYAENNFTDPRNIEVQKKVRNFLKNLNHWRGFARKRSVVDLLDLLYKETGYPDYVGGMTSGKQRKANLKALYHRAARYEETSFKGLYRFIRFVDKMQEKDKDLAEPTSILLEENAIRVMTIHASKGLEFPLVFLMDMSKRFNNMDWVGNYVLDRRLGIGLKYKNPVKQIQSATFVDTAIKNRKKKDAYAEEMRLLYVAMTRAEQKLFLVGSVKSKEAAFKKWDKGNSNRNEVLDARLRFSTNNFMDWIGLAIARHELADVDTDSLQENQQIKNYPVDFDYRFYSEDSLSEDLYELEKEEKINWLEDLESNKLAVDLNEKPEKNLVDEALKIIQHNYHYDLSTKTSNYQSVSEVKQLFEEPDDGQLVKIDLSAAESQNLYQKKTFDRPKFLQESSQATAAEVGQATHLILQKMDLTLAVTEENIKKIMNDLVAKNILKDEITEKIEVNKIVRYFKSEFGQKIINHADKVKKEVLFSLLMEAKDVFEGMENLEDSILIHGIIDGYFETEEGLILFDYKTDRVSYLQENAKKELIKRYRGQLQLYKEALENITNKEVINTAIIALDIGETIYLS